MGARAHRPASSLGGVRDVRPLAREHGSLKDRAAGRDFHRGNTPCVQHQEPIAVSTAEHAGVLRKRVDDVVDDLAFSPRTAVVVRDIHGVPADQPDTKH